MNPLETALEELNKRFISYCFEVESNVQLAVQSFLKTDLKSVQQVLDKDKEIDQMEITIEEECLKLLAVYQPLAKDLRLIVGILKIGRAHV